MNKPVSIFLFIALLGANMAQGQRYKNFAFEAPIAYELTDSLRALDELILDRKYALEYQVDAESERQYTFIHTTRLVNSDEAIESNNKIYLSANGGTEYLIQKARVIKPNGTISLLDEKDIQEGAYDDDGVSRKIFYYALEGLEKGSIIEEVSYNRGSAQYYGELVYFRGDEYRLNQSFELIAPRHLQFKFKSMNGMPEVQRDTTEKEVKRWYADMKNIEPIRDQTYVYPKTVKTGVMYKLDQNLARNKSDITSYGNALPYFRNRLNPELDKKQEKRLTSIEKEMNLTGKTDEALIYAIENYIKTNFNILDNNSSELQDFDFMFNNRATNDWGSVALMSKILQRHDISYEVVLTCDRSDLKFDPDFEAYLFLREVMLYFPAYNLFIAPGERFTRGKYIPDTWSNTYGLFIKEVSVGGVSTAVGEVKYIPALPYSANTDIMVVDVDFREAIRNPKITFLKMQMGYPASYSQPVVGLLDDAEVDDLRNSLVKSINEEMVTTDAVLTNTALNDYGSEPYEIRFSTADHRFVEDAGKDILFKVGELIGPQMQMYQATERQFPIEADFMRYYERTITLHLPENYELKNPEILNINRSYEADGDTTMLFSSEIFRNENTYTIKSIEYYDRIEYSVEEYQPYTEVINAAADFNKIVLLLSEK